MPKLTGLPGGKADAKPVKKAAPRRRPPTGSHPSNGVGPKEEPAQEQLQVPEATPEPVTDLLGALAESVEAAAKKTRPNPRGAARAVKERLDEAEAAEAAPEAEAATEVPDGAGDGKPKPKKKPARRPPAVHTRPAARAFTPDLSKLVPLNDQQEYLRVVLYGDQGVGKSTSLASLAHGGKVAIADTENSLRLKALKQRGIPTENLLIWTDWSYSGMEQFYVTVKAQLEDEPGSIFAVGIDTGTALTQWLLEEAVRDSLATPAMMKAHPGRTSLEVFRDDYGTLAEMVRSTITRKIYQLPCHVVITAHARRGENENGNVRVGPDFPPAVQSALMTYSDWVLRLTREEKKANDPIRFIRSAPRGNVEAKDRYGVLQEIEEDLSLWDMYEIWRDS